MLLVREVLIQNAKITVQSLKSLSAHDMFLLARLKAMTAMATTGFFLPRAPLPLSLSSATARGTLLGTFGRAAGLAVAAILLAFAAMASVPREGTKERPRDPVPTISAKDAARLSAAARDGAAPRAATQDPDATGSADRAGFFAASVLGGAFRFGDIAPDPDRFAPADADPAWREAEFAQVTTLDGATLEANGMKIRLVGLDLPQPDEICRTLDGRLERCAARAATQLELLTRWRRVTCDYRIAGAGEALGRCRIGSSDLTERMIRSGYAWQSAATAPRS
jgi:endonuclease YncB( thermonuclease family)